ncbi:retrovirus-related pol polyprotein from transposon TNT 1-94, partial [Tanacetum coccineum]
MSNSNTNLQTQSSNALHNAIMEAGSKDRPPMLAPGNYVQWKSRIKRYIDTKPNSELIHHCLQNPPYTYQWAEKTVPVAEGSSETTTERYMENYKNVSQDIRDQLNAEAEAVQIILTGIDNDIYSTVDACPNACEMWKAIERLKQGESINVQDLETNLYWEFGKFTSRDGESLESYYSRFYKMMNELVRNQCHVTNHQVNVQFLLQLQPEWQRFVTLVKQSQELKTVSYHKLYDILKQHQNEVNEIRAERLARTANPLALVAQQQPVYHHQNHPTQNTQYSSTRSQQSTRNRGKAIVTSSAPTYDPEPATVTEDEEMSKEKEIDKLMALISLSFKKIYKPTNNNLRTSSNTSRANQDNSPRINRGTGYDNQRAVNVAGARENVGTPVVQKSGIQCYNCKEYGHVSRECQKPKRVKDAAYHKEKMLLCKQEEAGVQLNAEQADWKDDTDDESEEQELEAHYMYMAQLQEVTPDQVDNSGPIFDDEPMHKVQNNNDNYNVFAIENEHPEQPESSNDIYLMEQGDTNITIDSSDICYDRAQDDQDETDDLDQERDLLASLIQKLKCEIDDSKNRNKFLESSNKELVDKLKGEIEDFKTKNKSLESSNNHFKEANNELSKTNQLMFKDLKKFQAELDKYNDVNYASKVEIDCAKAKGEKMRLKYVIDEWGVFENNNVISKIVGTRGKGSASSSSSSNSHNMAFMSSPSSTNEVNTAYRVSATNTQVSPASIHVSTVSTQITTANLCDDTVYAFLIAGNRIKTSSRKDCNMWKKRKTVNVEETSSKAMVAIDGAGFYWSYMADDEVPTNMALMAFPDSEVHNDKTLSKTCLKSFETLKTELDDLRIEFKKSEFNLATYKRGLASVEEQLVFYKRMRQINKESDTNKSRKGVGFVSYNAVPPPPTGLFSPPKFDLSNSGLEEFQQPKFEGYEPKPSKNVSEDISNKVRESPDTPLVKELVSDDKGNQRNWNNQKSQQLGSDFVMYNKACFICGSFDHVQANCNYNQRERVVSGDNYTRVNYNYSAKKAHPNAHRNMVLRAVLMKTGLRSFNTVGLVNTAHPKTIVYSARPMSHFSKSSQSTIKRPYQIRIVLTNKNFSQKVNTAKGKSYTARPKAVNTARPNSAVVNVVRANQ